MTHVYLISGYRFMIPLLFRVQFKPNYSDFYDQTIQIFKLEAGILLLQNFSVAISASPHVCFILVLIVISMFLI